MSPHLRGRHIQNIKDIKEFSTLSSFFLLSRRPFNNPFDFNKQVFYLSHSYLCFYYVQNKDNLKKG